MRLNGSLGLRKENPIAGAISNIGMQHRGQLVRLPGAAASFVFDGTLDSRITFTRASSGTYFDSSGVLQTAATNAARFDHNPSTGAWRGLLIEEARTNLCLQSEALDAAAWTTGAGTAVSADQTTAPDGNVTADKVTLTGGSVANNRCYQNITDAEVNGKAYTASVWMKADSPFTAVLRISNGSDGDGDVLNCVLTTEWQRFVISRTFTVSAANARISIGYTATNGVFYAWGAQLEQAASASSYIPTTTASVTRAADSAVVSSIPFFNAGGGTIVVEFEEPATSSTAKGVVSFDDGTAANRIDIRKQDATDIWSVISDTSVDQAILTVASISGLLHRAAASYKANSFKLYANGSAATPDTSGTVPTISQLTIGKLATGNALNGWVRRISYYNKQLTNNEHSALSK